MVRAEIRDTRGFRQITEEFGCHFISSTASRRSEHLELLSLRGLLTPLSCSTVKELVTRRTMHDAEAVRVAAALGEASSSLYLSMMPQSSTKGKHLLTNPRCSLQLTASRHMRHVPSCKRNALLEGHA